MKNIVILGGDERMLHLSEYLANCGFYPACYGIGKSISYPTLLKLLSKKPVTVILPLPSSRDSEHVNMSADCTPVSLELLYHTLKQGDSVFGGLIREEIREQLCATGAAVTDYYDEDFIVQNAQLTAVCLLAVIGKHIAAPLNTLCVAVTGYGRTARAIADVLKQAGAKITITARNREALKEAEEKGLAACPLGSFKACAASFDLIINTVPARIIGEEIIEKLTEKTTVIEIASPPFGVDFDCAGHFGIKAVKAMSLPGIYAPQDAGKIIGEKLKRLL